MLLNKVIQETNENGEVINEIITPLEITIIVTHHDKTEDCEEFDSFKYVDKDNGGKLVDCHFTRDVNTTKLAAAGKKIKATFEKVTINNNYEFAKCWCTGLIENTIKKVF